MKRIQAIALLAIASLSATTEVLAQDRAVKANVPFSFTEATNFCLLGNILLPHLQLESSKFGAQATKSLRKWPLLRAAIRQMPAYSWYLIGMEATISSIGS
jgi:hypothetical protein